MTKIFNVSGWLSERSRNGGLDEVPLPAGPGRLWLCGKHLVGPDPEAVLQRTGAAAVVCLNEDYELLDRYPDYVAWLRVQADAARAVWSPTPDMHAAPLEEFVAFISSLRARLEVGDGLVVHCGAGIGRAGTVAAALLMSYGASHDEALVAVRAARPSAGPQTAEQDRLLAAYAAILGS